MSERQLLCIVEGEGECAAVPIVVNRMLQHLRRDRTMAVDPEKIICAKNGDRITAPHDPARRLGIEFYVKLAVDKKPGAILVVVDAEERCVKRAPGLPGLGPHLLARANVVAGSIPLGVVVANRMFEAWFLADMQSLRARGHLLPTARLPEGKTAENVGGCKGWIKEFLGHPYCPTSDQASLSKHLSLPLTPAMQRRAPSFWKLFREVNKLSRQA